MKLIGQTFNRSKNINRSKNRVVSGMLAYSLVGDALQQGAGPAVWPGMARHVVSSPDLTG